VVKATPADPPAVANVVAPVNPVVASDRHTFILRVTSGRSQSLTIHRPVNVQNIGNMECYAMIVKRANRLIELWEQIDEIVVSAGTEGTVLLSTQIALDQLFELKPSQITVYPKSPLWKYPARAFQPLFKDPIGGIIIIRCL
jgi:hypothetical protein